MKFRGTIKVDFSWLKSTFCKKCDFSRNQLFEVNEGSLPSMCVQIFMTKHTRTYTHIPSSDDTQKTRHSWAGKCNFSHWRVRQARINST